MGDRGNVLVKDSSSRVFLYTHWGGSELPELVQVALRTAAGSDDFPQSRWGDAAYLTRIVFTGMIRDDVLAVASGKLDEFETMLRETTGYGISSRILDNEHPVIVLDADARRVSYVLEEEARAGTDVPVAAWTMAEFITAADAGSQFRELG